MLWLMKSFFINFSLYINFICCITIVLQIEDALRRDDRLEPAIVFRNALHCSRLPACLESSSAEVKSSSRNLIRLRAERRLTSEPLTFPESEPAPQALYLKSRQNYSSPLQMALKSLSMKLEKSHNHLLSQLSRIQTTRQLWASILLTLVTWVASSIISLAGGHDFRLAYFFLSIVHL